MILQIIIEDFAHLIYTFNKLTKKNLEFNWDKTCQNAFETLKTLESKDLKSIYNGIENQILVTARTQHKDVTKK